MISFCRIYNKLMLKLDENHQRVDQVNMLAGSIKIVFVFVCTIAIFILKPFADIIQYSVMIVSNFLPDNIPHLKLDWDYFFPFLIFLFTDLVFVYVFSIMGLWPIAIISAYILTILSICYFMEFVKEHELPERTFDFFVGDPINYMTKVTTSHCDLKK